MCDKTEWRGAHWVPLQPSDLLLCTGGKTCLHVSLVFFFFFLQETYLSLNLLGKKHMKASHSHLKTLLLFLMALSRTRTTANEASTDAPPPGIDDYYIPGLHCVCDQLCRSHHLSLQEEVMLHVDGQSVDNKDHL